MSTTHDTPEAALAAALRYEWPSWTVWEAEMPTVEFATAILAAMPNWRLVPADDLNDLKDREAHWHKLATVPADTVPVDAERLDLRDELTEAEHEVASFLHPYIWGDVPHVDEPGDGDDCHECYGQAERLFALIVDAAALAPAPSEPDPVQRFIETVCGHP